MGQFHFDVPNAAQDFVSRSLWKDAYICGIEGVPWQTHVHFDQGRLTISRNIDASGKLYLACPVSGIGYRTLSTCSLRALDDTAYLLPLELARGSCFRARAQSDGWQRAGLTLSETFLELLDRGTQKFLDAAQLRSDPCESTKAALESVRLLEIALDDLGESYATQSIAFRKQREPQLGTLLGGTVIPPSPTGTPHGEAFCQAFNTASVRVTWADIETDSGAFDYQAAEHSIRFCASKGMRIIAGPLIDFRPKLLPQWVYLFEDNFDAFVNAAVQFVEKTVERLRGTVQLWNCASGLNTPGPLEWDDEQLMRLTMAILQTVRRVDPNTPAIVSFDQPIGEYLAHHPEGISPLHFADALARSGLGLAGLGLEFRMGYQRDATFPRSAVDFGFTIDRWATLGIPMLVQIAVPGARGEDPNALAPLETLPEVDESQDPANDQLRLAGQLIRTLLAKQVVHGVVWDGWCDAEPHVVSHSGVIDASGQPRPLLNYLTQIRREFLT